MFCRRNFVVRTAAIVCALLQLLNANAPAAEEGAKPKPSSFQTTVKPFLAAYCTRCHGAKLQKAERRFDKLPGKIDGDNTQVDYQDILDQLNLGNMPPQEAKQPKDAERQKVIRWLTESLKSYSQTKNPRPR